MFGLPRWLCKILCFTNRCALLFHSCTNSQELMERVVFPIAWGSDYIMLWVMMYLDVILQAWLSLFWTDSHVIQLQHWTSIVSPADSQNDLAQVHLQNHVTIAMSLLELQHCQGRPRAEELTRNHPYCKTSSTLPGTVLARGYWQSPRWFPCMTQRLAWASNHSS